VEWHSLRPFWENARQGKTGYKGVMQLPACYLVKWNPRCAMSLLLPDHPGASSTDDPAPLSILG
jgi:hypothetical protein